MLKVFMVCAFAASSTLIMEKMQKAAERLGWNMEWKIGTVGESLKIGPSDYDIIALAPQVSFNMRRLKKYLEKIGSKTEVVKIPGVDYAMLDGESIVKKLFGKYF